MSTRTPVATSMVGPQAMLQRANVTTAAQRERQTRRGLMVARSGIEPIRHRFVKISHVTSQGVLRLN
jgi:hypothetical protein